MTRLLLIGCSASKCRDPSPLPAGARYTGVFYKVIAKARREERWPNDVRVVIISAKYGLLFEDTPGIEWYDQKMTRLRALQLQESIGRDLDRFFQQTTCEEVFVALGANYRLSLTRSHQLNKLVDEGRVHVCLAAGIGIMLQQLREWIDREKDT